MQIFLFNQNLKSLISSSTLMRVDQSNELWKLGFDQKEQVLDVDAKVLVEIVKEQNVGQVFECDEKQWNSMKQL